MNVCVYGICTFSCDETAIAGGWLNSLIWEHEYLKSSYIFQISYNRFIRIADLNVARTYCSLVNVCDLYCIGGYDGTYNYLSSIEKYNSNRNKWEVLDVILKVARSFHRSIAHEKLIITLR